MYRCILVATDGSTLSANAVNSAMELAALAKAKLVAVKVIPNYPNTYLEGALPVDKAGAAHIEAQWKATAQAEVDTIKEIGESHGIAVTALVVHSDLVADTLLAVAKQHDCDLIVMASHGRSGLKRLVLGSETQRVLTQSDIAVLVLR